MWWKLDEILMDIENEVDVYKGSSKEFYKEMFLKRLEYNLYEMKKIVVGEKQAEERMLNDLAKTNKGE